MSAEYAPSRQADLYGDAAAPTVLLWHDETPNSRHALTADAVKIATAGWHVIVPDWDASSPDHGFGDLLSSVRFARESAQHDPDALTLIGWGLGGTAAASLTLNQRKLGIGLSTCIVASADMAATDPLSRQPVPIPAVARVDTQVTFVADDQLPKAQRALLQETQDRWSAQGWNANFVAGPANITELLPAVPSKP